MLPGSLQSKYAQEVICQIIDILKKEALNQDDVLISLSVDERAVLYIALQAINALTR